MKRAARVWKAWAVGSTFYPQYPPETRRCRNDAAIEQHNSSMRGEMPTAIFRVEIRVIGRVKPTYYPTPKRYADHPLRRKTDNQVKRRGRRSA